MPPPFLAFAHDVGAKVNAIAHSNKIWIFIFRFLLVVALFVIVFFMSLLRYSNALLAPCNRSESAAAARVFTGCRTHKSHSHVIRKSLHCTGKNRDGGSAE